MLTPLTARPSANVEGWRPGPRVSLLLLASMPAASPDEPSDAEEGERRRGINAPPENGAKEKGRTHEPSGLKRKKARIHGCAGGGRR